MSPFESGRRLCLLVEAGGTRFSLEATSVMEVAVPSADGASLRGVLDVRDLSILLGGKPEPGQGMVVVFDVSPTLAVRVGAVVEVADVAPSPFFLLPSRLEGPLAAASRGAVLHKERLYLELVAEALPHDVEEVVPPPAPRPWLPVEGPPDRGLIFESQGRLFGLPLLQVSQVVPWKQSFSGVPGRAGEVAGLFPHGQMLWPLVSLPSLMGEAAQVESYFVLAEPGGQSVGLSASRVLGVYSRFEAGDAPGEFKAPGLPGVARFMDLQRMFS